MPVICQSLPVAPCLHICRNPDACLATTAGHLLCCLWPRMVMRFPWPLNGLELDAAVHHRGQKSYLSSCTWCMPTVAVPGSVLGCFTFCIRALPWVCALCTMLWLRV